MKNIIISGLLLGCISLMACEKENLDRSLIVKKKLIGKWTLVKHGDQIPIGANEQSHPYTNSSYEFHADETITMNFSGNMLKDEWILIDNGNMLHIDGQTGVYYKIQQLDEKELIIYHDYDIGQGPSRRTFYFKK